MKSQAMDSRNRTFVVCICNDEYEVSLELRKLYEVIRDEAAEQLNCLRVIDESGEDYLFPREYFAPVELSVSARSALNGKP